MKSLFGKMAAVIAGVFVFLDFAAFADLPTGYTQLQWIEAGRNQYIDTGVKAKNSYVITADMRLLSNEQPRQVVFGGADNDGLSVSAVGVTTRNNTSDEPFHIRCHGSKYASATTGRVLVSYKLYKHLGQRAVWKLNQGAASVARTAIFTLNGYGPDNTASAFARTATTSTNNIYICWAGGPSGGSTTFAPAAMVLYSFEILSGSTYLRKMVPAMRDSDGEIGMFDTVGEVFYPNLGSKPFVAGPRVSCVYPSEDSVSLGYRSELTVSGYTGGATVQSGLPVLVRISPSKIAGFSYGSCLAGGADVFFATDRDGLNRLACDIDTWDTAGESLAWVKLPEVTGTDTKFYMFWGSGEAAERPDSTEVWSEYIAVWHMNSCDPETGVRDETGHGWNATNSTTNVSTPTESAFGTGLHLSHGLYAPNYDSFMTETTNTVPDVLSISCWFKKPDGAGNERILDKYSSGTYRIGYSIQSSGATALYDYVANARKDGASAKSPNSTGLPDFTQDWLHHVLVSTGTNHTSFVNGAQKIKNTCAAYTDAIGRYNAPLRFGTGSNPISMDEVRITREVRSASWVKAEYDTMTNPDFVVAGGAESLQCAVSIAGTPAQYAANVVSYGTDTDVSIGTPKTYTAPAVVAIDPTNRVVCAGWTLYSTDPTEGFVLARTSESPLAGEDATTCIVTPTGNDALTWQWSEESFVDAAASVEGQGSVIGAGWCANGTNAALTAVPAAGYYFQSWTGATDGVSDIYSTNITVAVDAPVVLRAVFRPATDCVFDCSESGTVDFFDTANWLNGNAPASDGTSVVVMRRPPEGMSVTVIASNAIDIASLDMCYGSGTGSLTLEFGCGLATNRVAGDVILRDGATLTHTCHATTDSSKQYTLDIEVGGNVTIDAGASINVSGKGYYWKKGPGELNASDTKGAAHGGTGNAGYDSYSVSSAKCYGCIRRPVLPGSGGGYNGSYGYGGGVLHLVATNGTLTVNGTIASNGDTTSHGSPSGGSIWIECGSLLGSGGITAYSGLATSYGRGGGGRIAITQNAANDISGYTGYIRAGRSPVNATSYNYANSVGSIYIENANDEKDRGELLVDGYGYNNGGSALACRLDSIITDVAEPFGKVTVTRYGRLEIPAGVTLKVTKGISVTSNGDFHTVADGGAIDIMPGEDGAFSVEGLVKAYDIYCTNSPGATISFVAGAELRNLENGSIELCGTEAKPLSLLPAAADGTWAMNVIGPDDSKAAFEYIALSNCNATAGIPLTAYRSVNLGGNDNWGFLSDDIPAGTLFTWTGSSTSSSLWSNPANWDIGIVPRDSDFVRIPGGLQNYPVVDGSDLYLNSITNEAGASLTLSGVDLFVSNSLYSAGTIVDGGNRIVVFGDGDIILDFASGTAAKVYVEKTGGSVTLPSGFTAEKFYCVVPDALDLAFGAGEEFEFALCNIESRGNAPHILRSTTSGEQWSIALTANQRVRNVTVSDSDASGGAEVKATGAGSNSLNWNFGGNIVEWIAPGSGSWETAENWSTGVVPGENDDVYIAPTSGTVTVTVGAAQSIRSLTLGGTDASATLTSAYPISMSGNFILYNGATATLSSKETPNAVGGNVLMKSGSTMNHAANARTFANRLYMTVAGDMTIEEGASIYLTYCGFEPYYGPVDDTKNSTTTDHGGAHGSTMSWNGAYMACNDSIFEPVLPVPAVQGRAQAPSISMSPVTLR